MRWLLFVALIAGNAGAAALTREPPEAGSREARFAHPPPSARILPLRHYWPSAARRADEDLLKLQRQGFGGLACNVHIGTNYLDSAEYWEVFRHAVREMKSAGMAMWLYDELGYPSGTADDQVLRGHPEWAARGLLVAVTNATAGTPAELALPPGRFLRAVAHPLVGDRHDPASALALDGFAKAGRIVWTPPKAGPARWRLFALAEDFIYEGTHAAVKPQPRRYVNLLMPEPTARFIALTHERYAKELGGDLSAFASTFTDEPSLMAFWLRPMPYLVLPWCPGMAEDYRARTGRDALADVPSIVCEDASGTTPKARCAFWDIVGERVARNFFGPLAAWAKGHGLASGGHLFSEEGLNAHVALYGDFFRCLRAMSAPGVDCLTSVPDKVPWLTAQFAGSAGALNASRYVMCEASDIIEYRPLRPGGPRPGYQVSEDEVVGALNRLIWGGVNTFTSYHHWHAFADEQIRRINLTVGRTVTVMAEGWNAAEIALLYPAETLMATYAPLNVSGGGPANDRVTHTVRLCGQALFEAGLPFMFADARALDEATVEKGRLAHGNLRWRVVVLPRTSVLSASAVRGCHALWAAGGTVIAVGDVPANSPAAFPDAASQRLCAEMFGAAAGGMAVCMATNAAHGVGLYLPQRLVPALAEKIAAFAGRDLTVAEGAASARLRVALRRTKAERIFFVLNDSPNAWRGTVKLREADTAEIWDPRTGAHGVATRSAAGYPLALPPYGATLFVSRITCGPDPHASRKEPER